MQQAIRDWNNGRIKDYNRSLIGTYTGQGRLLFVVVKIANMRGLKLLHVTTWTLELKLDMSRNMENMSRYSSVSFIFYVPILNLVYSIKL